MAHVALPELSGAGRRGRLVPWAPVLAWMAAVFLLSSVGRLPGGSMVPDWLSHGLAYGVGGVLIARALAAGRPRLEPKAALLAVGLATLYGVTDEVHQSFVPGRSAEAADVAKDLGGAALFVFAYGRRRAVEGAVPAVGVR